jgi:4-hydroxybenzoate polyprenyltransferase
MRFLKNLLLIRRLEFRIAEIPIFAILVLLSVSRSAELRTASLWEGVFLFFLLFAFGDMINCLADRDLDAVYKKSLSQAVYGLGVPFVKFQIGAAIVVAVLIAAHLSWRLDRWALLGMVFVGLGLGAAYSVAPVRLKGRGVAALVCLWLIIFVGPMLLASLLVRPVLAWDVTAIALAFGTLQMGVTLVNTAEDYPEDLEAGVRTSVIALGLERAIRLAFLLVVVGGACTLGLLGRRLTAGGTGAGLLVALLPAVAAFLFVAGRIGRLESAMRQVPLEQQIALVKRSAKEVPLWFTVNAWSVFIAALAIFLTHQQK